jgi:hypothetical protein
MEKQLYSCDYLEYKSKWEEISEVFYPANEADKHLEMIRPILREAWRLVDENPGQFPILEWFLRYYMLYGQGELENID